MSSVPRAFAAQQVITSAGPLTNVYLNDNLGCQGTHSGDTQGEFFGGTDPGACGTFVSTNGVSYGPNVPAGDSRTEFVPVSQSAVTGSGSAGDPFTVVTAVDLVEGATTTLMTITQTDSYVIGQEFYRTTILLQNATASPLTATLYHGGDCYLQDSDVGFGFHDASGGGSYCSANAGNSPPGRIEGFVPISAGSQFYEANFSAVWAAIDAAGSQFPDTVDADGDPLSPGSPEDNGAGLSWPISLPASGSVTHELLTAFSPTGTVPGSPPPPGPPPTASVPTSNLAQLAAPSYGTSVNVQVIRGVVLVQRPGESGFSVLTGEAQIPVGSIIDARRGRVRITSASSRHGGSQSAVFYGGVFKLLQPSTGPPTTELKLVGFDPDLCQGGRTRHRAHTRRNGLWGSGKGNYLSKGKHGSATVRGTIWLTADTCAGTAFKVKRGVVFVRDFTRDKTVRLTAGERYLAPAR